MLNYDFKYVEHKRNGYYGRQIFNATKPSTYLENYRQVKQPYFTLLQKQLIAIFVIAACAYLLAFEVGLIDFLF